MNLWIRSQNKEIFGQFNDIVIKPHGNNDWLGTIDIIGYFDKNTEYEVLGNYQSHRRALEVLDEIQDGMIKVAFVEIRNGLNELINIKPNSIYVYTMPLE